MKELALPQSWRCCILYWTLYPSNRVEDYNYDEAVDGVSAKRAFEDETVMDEDGECVNAVGVFVINAVYQNTKITYK